jgi:alcohol dehydrogenase
MPNQVLFIGLLVVFEATVGVLSVSGGRRTRLGYVGMRHRGAAVDAEPAGAQHRNSSRRLRDLWPWRRVGRPRSVGGMDPGTRRRLGMRALVYHGPGSKNWEEVAEPTIVDDTDAIVQVDAVTICGTDLHILKGDVPAVTDGRILGHEAVGTVTQVGAGVKNVRPGDRVLVSCISACGRCRYCRDGSYGQCRGGGGWILGHRINGTQAEYVRVPFADNSTYPVPAGVTDEEVLMLADILPTGYEVGVLNGSVRPGDTVAIVGAGPIGLAATLGAKLHSPSHVVAIDIAAGRLDAAKQFGADIVVNSRGDDPVDRVMELTDGLGADVAIEAVGVPETFELCTRLVRPGGHVANVGVHGKPATLHLEDLWIKNVTITTGLVDTYSTPTLLRLVAARQIDASRFVTHRFGIDGFLDAYDVFSRAGETGALKVVLSRH